MHFQLATLADFPIWHRFRDELYSDLDPAFSEAEIHRIANDPNMFTFLLFDKMNEPPIGMLELSLRNIVDGCNSSPVAYIDGLYVIGAWQSKGIGPKMVQFAKQWAKEQGCTELAVDTELDNEKAQRFYLRNGFEETYRIVQFRMDLS